MRQAWITKDNEETFGDDMFIILILVIISHVYTFVKIYKIVHVKYILLTVLWLYHKENVNKASYYWQTENKEHMYTCGRFILIFGKTNTIM